MSAVTPSRARQQGAPATPGLPSINYYLPMVVTFLASVLIFLTLLVLTMFAFLNSISQFQRAQGDNTALGASLCGVLGIVTLVGLVYFGMVLVKGTRDLFSPVYYTRGTISEKRDLGGRQAGNWLSVHPRYVGPDLATASSITDEQRAASPDRSQIFQPRFSPPSTRKPGAYLPAGRISGAAPVPTGHRAPTNARSERIDAMARQAFSDLGGEQSAGPRIVFRVDSPTSASLDPGEEVLVAHSRFLQHHFYVAHLNGGEWESFRNKALI